MRLVFQTLIVFSFLVSTISNAADRRRFIAVDEDQEDFLRYLAAPEEVRDFLNEGQVFGTLIYPGKVADNFMEPVIFSSEVILGRDDELVGFTLSALIKTNPKPLAFINCFASFLLPLEYVMKDRVIFDVPGKAFIQGAVTISSADCTLPSGERSIKTRLAKKMLSVDGRAGFFMKVLNPKTNEFYKNLMFFLPDYSDQWTHWSVRFGEAFGLKQHNASIDDEEEKDMAKSFYKFVNTQNYGADGALYSLPAHKKVEKPQSL